MAALATDQTVAEEDLARLRAAVLGERAALREICDRYKMPILAVALQSSGDLESAYGAVERVLGSLCRQLLAMRFPPDQWASQLVANVAEYFRMGSQAIDDGETSLPSVFAGMASLPRIARRRVVRATLPKLPLPELTAILLRYVDGRAPSAMVGLVADSQREVCQRLVAAHQLLVEAVRTECGAA